MNSKRVEAACEIMHDAYEKAALGAGWETNPASRKPWTGVPEANKVTMRAAVTALLNSNPNYSETTNHKARAAGALALLGTLANALLDGHIDGGEWITMIAATVSAFAGVYAIKNHPKEPGG